MTPIVLSLIATLQAQDKHSRAIRLLAAWRPLTGWVDHGPGRFALGTHQLQGDVHALKDTVQSHKVLPRGSPLSGSWFSQRERSLPFGSKDVLFFHSLCLELNSGSLSSSFFKLKKIFFNPWGQGLREPRLWIRVKIIKDRRKKIDGWFLTLIFQLELLSEGLTKPFPA